MPRTKKTDTLRLSPESSEWMKTHDKRDLRDLAQELADRGEDVAAIVRAIDDLEEVEVEEEEWEKTHIVEDEE